jgi:hypothetical protein
VRTSGEAGVTIHDSAYSRTGTQALVNLFYAHTPVTMIFFNDPNVTGRGLQPWPNHDNHFHVRVQER